MNGRRYELIVFDWDGTLMDSAAKIVNCFQNAARDAALPVPDALDVRGIIGLGLPQALARLFPGADDAGLERVAEAYRAHFVERDQTWTGLFPGVREGLETLKSDDRVLAVATGKARRGLDRVLADTGTASFFTATRCVDEALSKPHPRMLEDILAHTGLAPHRALMVGDTTFDLQMASAAGMDAVAVSYGAHPVEPLLAENPRACLDDFDEVIRWIRAS